MENKIDFKNFTIVEFNSFVKSIGNGDISVSVSEGNNVNKEGTYTKKIDTKKLKDLSMSIGDSGKEISVVTGSENIYADVLVYDNNYDKGYKEYTISLFSKDDKKGLKSVVNSIIEKFKNGGGVGFRNIDKIKSNIGETVFNHINSLNKSQLEKQLSELKSELKSETKNTERHNKLKDEEWYILYRLERSSEFEYKDGGGVEDEDDEEEEMDWGKLSDVEEELSRLYKWKNQHGSKGSDAKIKQLEKRIQYLKSNNKYSKGGGVQKTYALIHFSDKKPIKKRYDSSVKAFSDYEEQGSIYAELFNGNGVLLSTYPKKENKYAKGGATKGFNYSIGGL